MLLSDLVKQLLTWAGIPGVAFGIAFWLTNDFVQSILVALVAFILNAILVFVGQVLGILKDDVVKFSAKRLSENWQRLTGRYMPAYRTYLRNAFFNVDLGGVGEQNDYNIEMDSVFVELRIDTRPAGKAETAAIPDELLSSTHTIWDFLSSTELNRLAILGYPGSGKTTLMKHVALTLLGRHTFKRLKGILPIFVELRRQHKFILETPDCTLIDVIVQSLSGDGLRPPPRWFEQYLNRGQCLVMFDGLDEVSSSDERQSLIAWFDRMVSLPAYSQNQFIITSRPLGYRHNPSNRVDATLEVQAFSPEQQRQFINGWYLADEIKREAGKRSPRVQEAAQKLARALDMEIRQSEAFSDLAQNPLLITMIAIVYRQRQKLPENRAALYAEICEVFLGKRWQARGIKLPLRADQAQAVLQPLAFHMMQHNTLELAEADVLPTLASPLAQMTGDLIADRDFLEVFELRTGVLIAREKGIYSFAHRTFQEFLTAVHIHENKLESNLITALLEDPGSDWWSETARLYAAQSDASNLIRALLDHQPMQAALIALAIDCERLAKRISVPGLRTELKSLIEKVVEDHNHPAWAAVAEALLRYNLTQITIIDENIQALSQPISHSDYQLCVDALGNRIHLVPFHRKGQQVFEIGSARQAITGLTPWQAEIFCQWLNSQQSRWQYRLPTVSDQVNLDGNKNNSGQMDLIVDPSSISQPSWGRIAGLYISILSNMSDLNLPQNLSTSLESNLASIEQLIKQLENCIQDMNIYIKIVAAKNNIDLEMDNIGNFKKNEDKIITESITTYVDAIHKSLISLVELDFSTLRMTKRQSIQYRQNLVRIIRIATVLRLCSWIQDLHFSTKPTPNGRIDFEQGLGGLDKFLKIDLSIIANHRDLRHEHESWLYVQDVVRKLVQELEAIETTYRVGQGPPEQLTLIRQPITLEADKKT